MSEATGHLLFLPSLTPEGCYAPCPFPLWLTKLEWSSSSPKSLSRNPGASLTVKWLTAQFDPFTGEERWFRRRAMAPFPINQTRNPLSTVAMPVSIPLLILSLVQWNKIKMSKCQPVRRLGEIRSLCHRV